MLESGERETLKEKVMRFKHASPPGRHAKQPWREAGDTWSWSGVHTRLLPVTLGYRTRCA